MKNQLLSHRLIAVAFACATLVIFSGCQTTNKKPPVSVGIFLQASSQMPSNLIRPITFENPRMMLYVKSTSELTHANLRYAETDNSPGGPFIRLVFDDHGTNVLRWLTTEYRNRYLVIFINNSPVMPYYVTRTIADGRLTVAANFTEEEVKFIVEGLQPKKLEPSRFK